MNNNLSDTATPGVEAAGVDIEQPVTHTLDDALAEAEEAFEHVEASGQVNLMPSACVISNT